MVYIDDRSEDVTDAYETTRDGQQSVVVETDDGYFEYWFPYVDASEKAYVDAETVLDPMEMAIRENAENASEYDGTDPITVPQSVADRAEEVSGLTILE